MIFSEQKSADPGRKESPFPTWLLRYASQTEPLPLANVPAIGPEQIEEKGYSELDHFVETEPSGSADLEPSADQTNTD